MINQLLKLKYGKEFYTRNIDDLKLESQDQINKLESGMPLHKALGYIELTGVHIDLSNNVLIPRYETEELIKESLKYINSDSKVLDLCTGSGYIALAIKKITAANVVASDISEESIKQTQMNAKINNLKIKIIQSDLFQNINEKFDVIISNPPYIPTSTKLDLSVVNYEPGLALFGGNDGNDIYKKIIKDMSKYLKPNGVVLFEISEDNALFIKAQGFEIKKDINDKFRIAILK